MLLQNGCSLAMPTFRMDAATQGPLARPLRRVLPCRPRRFGEEEEYHSRKNRQTHCMNSTSQSSIIDPDIVHLVNVYLLSLAPEKLFMVVS